MLSGVMQGREGNVWDWYDNIRHDKNWSDYPSTWKIELIELSDGKQNFLMSMSHCKLINS